MHLVFLNQYYPPDVAPTGVMLKGVVEELIRQGHEVTVICAEGGYAAPSVTDTCQLIGDQERFGAGEGDTARESGADSAMRTVRVGATRFGRKSFLGKLADYAFYYAGAKWKLLTMQPRPDRIIALTTPPFLSILARALSKLRGGDHAHWVMDLYPDVMVAHGMLKSGGMAHRLLASFARWGFGGSRCAVVLTLGPDMADRLGAHVGAGRKVEWVPLWGSGEKEITALAPTVVVPSECKRRSQRGNLESVTQAGEDITLDSLRLRRERGWRDDELIVMYSGNMGRGHSFGEIFGAAKVLAGRNGPEWLKPSAERSAEDSAESDPTARENNAFTRFVFFGGGKRKREVSEFCKRHPECGVELHDYSSADELNEHLQSADIQLVSLDGSWSGTMVPSKLQGIFGVGRPAIFIGSRESSINKWILESGGGWVVGPGDVQGLVAAIDEGRDPYVRRKRGEAAAAFAARHFSKKINTAQVASLFQEKRS